MNLHVSAKEWWKVAHGKIHETLEVLDGTVAHHHKAVNKATEDFGETVAGAGIAATEAHAKSIEVRDLTIERAAGTVGKLVEQTKAELGKAWADSELQYDEDGNVKTTVDLGTTRAAAEALAEVHRAGAEADEAVAEGRAEHDQALHEIHAQAAASGAAATGAYEETVARRDAALEAAAAAPGRLWSESSGEVGKVLDEVTSNNPAAASSTPPQDGAAVPMVTVDVQVREEEKKGGGAAEPELAGGATVTGEEAAEEETVWRVSGKLGHL